MPRPHDHDDAAGPDRTEDEVLLRVSRLSVEMPLPGGGLALPVDDVSFVLRPGESLGVVGESGAGKSMLAKAIARLVRPPAEIVGSQITLSDRNLLTLAEAQMRHVRGSRIAFVFQDPMTSMNPVSRVSSQLAEAVRETDQYPHSRSLADRLLGRSRQQLSERLAALLRSLGIGDAERVLHQYPMGLSGGMNQRVMIGMAVAAGAELVIADEPTTALDPTTQIQILDLLAEQRRTTGYGMMLISHNIRLIGAYCDRVMVMYGGRVVETGTSPQVLTAPRHPYTRLLIRSAGYVEVDGEATAPSGGTPGLRELAANPDRCHFAPRCPFAQEVCFTRAPDLVIDPGSGRAVACHGIAEGFVPLDDPAAAAVANHSGSAPATGPTHSAGTESQPAAGADTDDADSPVLLELKQASVTFHVSRTRHNPSGTIPAVRGIDLSVRSGETLALVGESGCGKSTTGEVVAHLRRPTGGALTWHGRDLWSLSSGQRQEALRRIQVVFQNPRSSLDPRWSVERVLREPLEVLPRDQRDKDLGSLLVDVGLDAELLPRRVTELSGGQAQRVAVARALVASPEFILLDEPTSALDVTVRTQILQLLRWLRREYNLTYLFISHDFDAVRALADRVAVMYLGKVVETGPIGILDRDARHPYTMVLRDSLPALDQHDRPATPVEGEVPSLTAIPTGCPFRTRCPFATDLCEASEPELRQIKPGHMAACHYADTELTVPVPDPVTSTLR